MKTPTPLMFNSLLAVIGALILAPFSYSASIAFMAGMVLSSLIFCRFPHQLDSAADHTTVASDTTITLYVGNLPYRADELAIRNLFESYGHVLAVRLMVDKRTNRKRGFGFVEVSANDAPAVIEALNDYLFMERQLKVRLANEPKFES
ncbi:RNA-binding protein [Vibrio sp. SM6]|uniref:RNA-binding protein n=1 Tax=Vibrio agarilyticus TaxID=2726741 RepID=A0A7X8TSS5_9VIBR|nr:RNA-binding protein [Vibrio agarilyticus]NLS13618.1 RNA-binding protein [Vibrio agarilyticus]